MASSPVEPFSSDRFRKAIDRVRQQAVVSIQTMADFDKPGVTIGVLDMSLAVDVTSNAFPNAQLKTYVEDGDLFQALLDGKISAAVADSPEPEIISKLYSDQVDLPATKVLATFPAAFATRRGEES